jgi:predicted nucleic acid-binding protein
MTVLVSDSSVLIDLERGDFLEAIFSLNYQFAVPDVLYRQEMAGTWGKRLVELGLRVEEVSAAGVAKALRYRSTRPALSVPDSFALALAQERRWTLLTGDRDLRELAETESVDCHGVLWLLDRMEEAGVPDIRRLLDGLRAISRHPRCRLPRREVTTRLERYEMSVRE